MVTASSTVDGGWRGTIGGDGGSGSVAGGSVGGGGRSGNGRWVGFCYEEVFCLKMFLINKHPQKLFLQMFGPPLLQKRTPSENHVNRRKTDRNPNITYITIVAVGGRCESVGGGGGAVWSDEVLETHAKKGTVHMYSLQLTEHEREPMYTSKVVTGGRGNRQSMMAATDPRVPGSVRSTKSPTARTGVGPQDQTKGGHDGHKSKTIPLPRHPKGCH
ncbi:hypothetical protein E3N88_11205 [Mikania micrantha]|uniref:Uncharacterized protein n=1 Tax=Mikania micrantha TaxID=192012 RepID=A0A5N6PES0_9ASTR|nr:hypothetical protein E3N88_11205 [Mikania micrantha]